MAEAEEPIKREDVKFTSGVCVNVGDGEGLLKLALEGLEGILLFQNTEHGLLLIWLESYREPGVDLCKVRRRDSYVSGVIGIAQKVSKGGRLTGGLRW